MHGGGDRWTADGLDTIEPIDLDPYADGPRPQVLPLGSAEAAISRYREAGGVVEFVLVDAVEGSEHERHRAAAITALADIVNRRDSYRTIVTRPSEAVGHRIDVRTFVGRGYDWATRRLVSTWHDTPPGGRSKDAAGEFLTDGYAEAFSDPPYRMQATLDQLSDWFEAINRSLLGGLDEGLTVWDWSTDWSTWFDDGHEWWGSFLWTVERAGLPWITAIAASSTD